MRIVDRATFLSLPENTVYRKYEPVFFNPTGIKIEKLRACLPVTA